MAELRPYSWDPCAVTMGDRGPEAVFKTKETPKISLSGNRDLGREAMNTLSVQLWAS